ncbi:hypothetical protein KI387_013910 [Taxus chinensis]|uniref:Uncharacterized protein n=1 Tax=Taxus chinensis TaxID=29808 RepID=A0AA38CM54_TAXCH|nr:hypothetical protein KI387_013910 [Taxus chinensis]
MVGFVKKILGHLGLWKEENNDRQQQHQQQNNHYQQQEPSVNNTDDSRQGFRMRMPMPTTETVPQGPVVHQCWGNDGGVQGFRWYAQKLQVDEDGDIAEEFLNEVLPNVRAPG